MRDNLVVKSTRIIEASYSLSVNEQRLLLACISQIDSQAELDVKKGYTLTVDEAQGLFYSEKDRKNAYRDLRSASENLYRREIRLRSDSGRYDLLTRWVSSVQFDNEEMTATLFFHDQIKPYISQLRNNFTEYRLGNIVQLTSVYAVRVYELIVAWSFNSSYKKMEISEFRELLGISDKYRQNSEFNRFVVKPATEQINEFTDFEIQITLKKKGRSFHWIQLRYQQKEAARISEEKRKLGKSIAASDSQTRDDDTADLFTRLSDKQINFIARNMVFQEHIGEMGKLPAGETFGSEKIIKSAISYLKKGDFDERTKWVIQGTLNKIKQS